VRRTKLAVALWLSALPAILAGEGPGPGGPRGGRGDDRGVFLTDVPEQSGSVILGRPTDKSVTLNIIMREMATVVVAYAPKDEIVATRTEAIDLAANHPREVALSGLKPDTAYYFRVLDGKDGKNLLPAGGDGTFHTARPPGSAFTFVMQADSHLDGNSSPELYRICLANELADKPDFLVDLGDTFMTEKHEDRKSAAAQYAAQRYYLGLVGHSVPLFLVLGNHDGEENFTRGGGGGDDLAAWSCAQRKRLFPNPEPDAFYSGNGEKHPQAGLLQDYYAWTWGDALFVALDQYWFSKANRGGKDAWNPTLGKTQYDWLAKTLRGSKAKHKFIFLHQLVGGLDKNGRGGAEAAKLYEWGGRDADGNDAFAKQRPDWGKPIHALLVETSVSAVFHGHDHFFAHQELDGVVYQLVPQPAARNFQKHSAEEYGYKQGDFLPAAGHLRVRVSPAEAVVEYVRAATEDMVRRGVKNGAVAFEYKCRPRAEDAAK
jgi:phosphodiesterase/alkaline phosphatase D-like protein